jgi:hypothetical protein
MGHSIRRPLFGSNVLSVKKYLEGLTAERVQLEIKHKPMLPQVRERECQLGFRAL